MIINLLANNGYIVLNKILMKKVGLHEAILIGELSSEYVYWNKKNELQDNYFYSTRENIEEQTMLSSYQQRIAIENLRKQNILKVKQVGMPSKNWYSIIEDGLVKVLNGEGNFVDILANNNFIVVNKTLMKIIGLHEAIVLGELSAQMLYWEKENMLEDGFFYSTREKIESQTMLSAYSQRIAIDNLKRLQIIETVQKGMPLRTWYSINENVLQQILFGNSLISSSKKIEHQDVKKINNKLSINLTSSSEKNEYHVVKKLDTNNNKNNKIDILFNYIINNEQEIPKEFKEVNNDKIINLLKTYDMLYNKKIIEIFNDENLEKIKNVIYIIALMAKDNLENLSNRVNRDVLLKIYDDCKAKEKEYEASGRKINDFTSYYYKSVVNELLKAKKPFFNANKTKEGEDEDEEECEY